MERSKLREQLQLSPLFAGADTSGLTVRERSFLPGQTVKDSLNDIPCLGVVIEGLVNVFSVAPDGNSVLLNRLKRGGCFGICNLMSEDPMETVLISSGNSTKGRISAPLQKQCVHCDEIRGSLQSEASVSAQAYIHADHADQPRKAAVLFDSACQ